jgi:hypothetical protein
MSHRKVISLTTIASLCVACVSADVSAADVAARGGSVTSGFANGNYFNGGIAHGNYFTGGVANRNGGFANRNASIGYFNGGFGSATFNSLGTSNPRNGVLNTDFPGLGHNPSQNPIAFPIGGRVIQ